MEATATDRAGSDHDEESPQAKDDYKIKLVRGTKLDTSMNGLYIMAISKRIIRENAT